MRSEQVAHAACSDVVGSDTATEPLCLLAQEAGQFRARARDFALGNAVATVRDEGGLERKAECFVAPACPSWQASGHGGDVRLGPTVVDELCLEVHGRADDQVRHDGARRLGYAREEFIGVEIEVSYRQARVQHLKVTEQRLHRCPICGCVDY